jgi:hypothetical protein
MDNTKEKYNDFQRQHIGKKINNQLENEKLKIKFKGGKEISSKSHNEKSCSWKPHYPTIKTQKPLKCNCVVIMSSKVQLLCNYTL